MPINRHLHKLLFSGSAVAAATAAVINLGDYKLISRLLLLTNKVVKPRLHFKFEDLDAQEQLKCKPYGSRVFLLNEYT
uniref:Uncharacterized protein n=1 Tax=Glossina pallidipes TaxID=7398 RepID=A0A1A9ZI98_GLOPL